MTAMEWATAMDNSGSNGWHGWAVGTGGMDWQQKRKAAGMGNNRCQKREPVMGSRDGQKGLEAVFVVAMDASNRHLDITPVVLVAFAGGQTR